MSATTEKNACRELLFIILAVAVVYANSIYNPFIWDDFPLIVENPFIKNIGNFFKLFTADLFHYSYEKGNYYRPLQAVTYAFDYAAWKLNPFGYHITNILLHAIVSCLFYALIHLLTKNRRLALISALLFAVNPIHTEAVTYIAGRADSLAAIFILLSLIFYISVKNKLRYVLSLLCFACALLSKEIAVILPFLLVLYDRYFPTAQKPARVRTKPYLAYFLVLAIYGFLRIGLLNFNHKAILNIHQDLFLRCATFTKALLIYLKLILLPVNLHMERWLPIPNSAWDSAVFLSLAAFFLLVIAIVMLYKRQRLTSFGLAWFLLNLALVSGVFAPTKNLVMAEHWLYLPSLGCFLILGIVFDRLIKRNKRAFIILAALLAFYSYLSIRQNTTWKDPANFYKRITLLSPGSSKAHFNLGLVYEQNMDYTKAIAEYGKALEIEPDYFAVHNNIGNIYAGAGNFAEALREYKRCIEIKPDYFLAYNNLGNLYAAENEPQKAAAEYKKSINLNPYYSESHNNLGLLYLENNNEQLAGEEFDKALKLNPENPEAYNNMGNLYAKRGIYSAAIKFYRQAIELKKELAKAHFNLGVAYFKENQIGEAKKEWEKVLRINPRHSGALSNLGLLNSQK